MNHFSFFKKFALSILEKFTPGKNIKQWQRVGLLIYYLYNICWGLGNVLDKKNIHKRHNL